MGHRGIFAAAWLALWATLAACSRPGDGDPEASVRADPCAGLHDPVELAVCRHPDLKAMDADASRLYQRVLARVSHNEKPALRAAHADWRRRLEACAGRDEDALLACIDAQYNERIVDLQRRLRDLTG